MGPHIDVNLANLNLTYVLYEIEDYLWFDFDRFSIQLNLSKPNPE
jgi:hypothetical protein